MRNNLIRSGLTSFLAAVLMILFTSSAYAVLNISVMPSGASTPPNAWDSRPYTWPGNNLELWGRVTQYTGGLPLTYTWDFGAGEGSATGTVGNADNIAESHTYGATGSYVATLTVSDVAAGGIDTASAKVFIDVAPNTLDVSKNLAIQRALKYLYMNRLSWNITGNTSCDAYYWSNTDWTGDTGLAVLAFEDYNHRATNDPNQDIYADTVQRGLWFVEGQLRTTDAANTPNTDSDLNGNGLKTYEAYSGGNAYRNGIVAMAIANSKDPTHVSTCGFPSGEPGVQGMSYKTILEDVVDYIAYAQEDRTYCSGYGGWRYSANYCSSDNSVSQWPVLGLTAAGQAPWLISPPGWVKDLMKIWSGYSQNAGNGAFGYTYSGEWNNVAKTGSGVIQMKYSGISGTALTNAINYIGNDWCDTGWDYGNIGDNYAMYAVKKGLQNAGITDLTVPTWCNALGTVNWQNEYDSYFVNHQIDGGTNGVHWPGSIRISEGATSAAFGLLVMSKGLTESPPVAVAGGAQEVPPLKPVSFDGSASYHTDPTKAIVQYDWDYDYDGISFHPILTGVKPTYTTGYALPAGTSSKIYTVALRVTDNNLPPLTGFNTTTVKVSNGNQAPVANAGGPYSGAVGSNITLDGSKSYDPNSQGGSNPIINPLTASGFDEIVSYDWDLTGNGLFADAHGVKPVINFGTFIGTKTISLKVTDSFGNSGVQSSSATTVAVSDVQPMCYVRTLNAYNPITKKWTAGWSLNLQNVGNGSASNLSATLTSIPSGVTVVKGTLSWSGSIGAGGNLLSSDDFRYSYGSSAVPALTSMTWDISLTDALGQSHVIRKIPQGSGTCPANPT